MQFLDKAGLKLIKRYIDQSVTSASIQYGTTEYWNSKQGYVPAKGEIIVYSDHSTIEKDGQIIDVPGIKIGSGNGYVQDLVFIDDGISDALLDHINNTTIHVSSEDRLR